jgi:hypothetical protein
MGKGGLRAAFLFAASAATFLRTFQCSYFPKRDGRSFSRYPLPPAVYCNHRLRGKSRFNPWGTITCGQNLCVKELSGRALEKQFQNGTDAVSAHRHGLGDHRAIGLFNTRADVTTKCGKAIGIPRGSSACGVPIRRKSRRMGQPVLWRCRGIKLLCRDRDRAGLALLRRWRTSRLRCLCR